MPADTLLSDVIVQDEFVNATFEPKNTLIIPPGAWIELIRKLPVPGTQVPVLVVVDRVAPEDAPGDPAFAEPGQRQAVAREFVSSGLSEDNNDVYHRIRFINTQWDLKTAETPYTIRTDFQKRSQGATSRSRSQSDLHGDRGLADH